MKRLIIIFVLSLFLVSTYNIVAEDPIDKPVLKEKGSFQHIEKGWMQQGEPTGLMKNVKISTSEKLLSFESKIDLSKDSKAENIPVKLYKREYTQIKDSMNFIETIIEIPLSKSNIDLKSKNKDEFLLPSLDNIDEYFLKIGYNTVTYNGANNVIVVTGGSAGTPINFSDIYNADVVGGWGVVSKQGGKQFYFEARLEIGNATTAGYFKDTNKQIVWKNLNIVYNSATAGAYIRVLADSTFIIGEVVSATDLSSKDGCTFIDNQATNHNGILTGSFNTRIASATIEIYSSKFIGPDPATGYVALVRHAEKVWNSEFYGGYVGNSDDYINNGCYGGLPGSGALSGTMDRIRSQRCVNGGFFFWNTGGVASNVYIRNSVNYDLFLTSVTVSDMYLVNPDLDTWRLYWHGGTTKTLYRQYTFNITVTDTNNTPIQDTNVTLRDKDNNIVFQANTTSTGQLPVTKTVSYGYYTPAGGDTISLYSPHKLQINKSGQHIMVM